MARSTSGTVETEENENGKTAGSRAMSILRMTDPLARMEQWTALLQSVDADGIKAILGGLDELYLQGFILGEFEAPILHYRLGQLLGVKTLLLNFPLDAGAALSPEHARKMHGWAAANPSEARAWILKQPPGSLRDSLLKSWFEGISRSSPSEAMTWFNQLPEESRAGTLQGLIIAMNNTRGTPGVVQWLDAETASGTSAVPLKEAWSRLAWIVGQTASENPQAAYDFLLEPSRAGYLTTDSFNHALRNITGDHPGKAIELLDQLSSTRAFNESELRQILSYTASRARRSGLNELGGWLNQNPGHPLYGLTVRYFVDQVAKDDPQSAQAWVEKISDENLKSEAARALNGRTP